MSMDAFTFVIFCFGLCFAIAFLLFLFILAFGEKIDRVVEKHEKWVNSLSRKQQNVYFTAIAIIGLIVCSIIVMEIGEQVSQVLSCPYEVER